MPNFAKSHRISFNMTTGYLMAIKLRYPLMSLDLLTLELILEFKLELMLESTLESTPESMLELTMELTM